jgi:hypothetical protein
MVHVYKQNQALLVSYTESLHVENPKAYHILVVFLDKCGKIIWYFEVSNYICANEFK